MKVISLEVSCAKEIAEKGLEFEGRLKGILATNYVDLRQHTNSEEYIDLMSGCYLTVETDDENKFDIHFIGVNDDGSDYRQYLTHIPVVLSLPLIGEKVEILGDQVVKFDIDCPNKLWRLIIENYRKTVLKRTKIELGIDVEDYLSEDPIFCNVLEEIYNTTQKEFDDIKSEYIKNKPFHIRYRINIGKDDRELLRKIYERRNYLFNKSEFESRELGEVQLSALGPERVIEIGQFFSPNEELIIKQKEEEDDQ